MSSGAQGITSSRHRVHRHRGENQSGGQRPDLDRAHVTRGETLPPCGSAEQEGQPRGPPSRRHRREQQRTGGERQEHGPCRDAQAPARGGVGQNQGGDDASRELDADGQPVVAAVQLRGDQARECQDRGVGQPRQHRPTSTRENSHGTGRPCREHHGGGSRKATVGRRPHLPRVGGDCRRCDRERHEEHLPVEGEEGGGPGIRSERHGRHDRQGASARDRPALRSRQPCRHRDHDGRERGHEAGEYESLDAGEAEDSSDCPDERQGGEGHGQRQGDARDGSARSGPAHRDGPSRQQQGRGPSSSGGNGDLLGQPGGRRHRGSARGCRPRRARSPSRDRSATPAPLDAAAGGRC